MKNLLKIIAQKILGKNQSNLLDLCVIGLGNPGDKYNQTRHNAGYDYLDLICNQLNIELKKSKKIDGLLGEITYKDLQIGFVKPNEFINNSGKTLSLIKKYKVKELSDVLVIHDDMDLESGEVKLKIGGGHGGHRGLKDIVNKAGNNFVRLRLGIGHPPVKEETNAWVIKKPTPSEKEGLNNAFAKADESLDQLLNKEWLIAMNDLHTK